jgi:response regulator of citrate/malate metabolism
MFEQQKAEHEKNLMVHSLNMETILHSHQVQSMKMPKNSKMQQQELGKKKNNDLVLMDSIFQQDKNGLG